MATHKRHTLVSLCLVTAIAIAPLLVAQSADAATSALFRMKRTWWGSTTTAGTPAPYYSTQFHPRSKGPNKATDPTVFVGSTTVSGDFAGRFTVPDKFIKDYTWTSFCAPGTCSPGYPESYVHYSYWNRAGSFRPNNSRFGGASMTTTVIFETTMGNPLPPINSGNPQTATTTPCVGGGFSNCGQLFHDLPYGGTPGGGPPGRYAGASISFVDGNYDFDRAGSIMITPGKHRFGGTMQFFYGPNHIYYQRQTIIYGYSTHGYGPQMDVRTDNNNTYVGDVQYGGPFLKYRMTLSGSYREITTSGDFYLVKAPYFYTLAPFTTGTVTAVEPHGGQLSEFTLHGYDNRTPLGENGIVSMVRPRISRAYQVPHDVEEPIIMNFASISAWQMDFHFRPLPEPGSTAMLASGLLAIAGLYRLRRR